MWDCIPSHTIWSCAFDLQSCVLQMQSFLFDKAFLYRGNAPFASDPATDEVNEVNEVDEVQAEWTLVQNKHDKKKNAVQANAANAAKAAKAKAIVPRTAKPAKANAIAQPEPSYMVNLPSEMFMEMFAKLSAFDAAAFYKSSRSIQAMVPEDDMWRTLMRRDFPSQEVQEIQEIQEIHDNFKLAYVKEMVNFRGEFACFYTKKTPGTLTKPNPNPNSRIETIYFK